MLVQGNRSGVFMLLSAGGCKFSSAGTEGHLVTQLQGLASARPVLGWWLQGDGVGLLDEALLPPGLRSQGLLVAPRDAFHSLVSFGEPKHFCAMETLMRRSAICLIRILDPLS